MNSQAVLRSVAILVVVSCTASETPPLRTSTPSSTATPVVVETPAPSASASPTTEPVPSLHVTALGQVRGNWLFYGVSIPRSARGRYEIQVIAVPLAGGAAKGVITYDAPMGGVPEGIFDSTPYLRRQFSPDGMHMVFSIDGQIVVIDLVTGQAKPLGVSGYFPSWSKDGSQIAFLFEKPVADVVPPLDAIAVIPVTGGAPRELTVVGYLRQPVEWSPDGSKILFGYNDGTATLDVASGRVLNTIAATPPAVASFGQWRVGRPELAVATVSCTQASSRIVTMDDAVAPVRTLVEQSGPCGLQQFRDPRWNPAGGSELLYVTARSSPGVEPSDYETHVFDTATGKDTRLPLSAYEATWSWDGSAVAYLAKNADARLGSAVRVWKRDGSGEIELRRVTPLLGEQFFSIASVTY